MREILQGVATTVSAWAVPVMIGTILVAAVLRRLPVYEEFVEGAKDGFQVGLRIIPFLVAMLVAMGMFRASGAIDVLKAAAAPLLGAIGFPPDLLPMAIMRPLSGSGAQGLNDRCRRGHGGRPRRAGGESRGPPFAAPRPASAAAQRGRGDAARRRG